MSLFTKKPVVGGPLSVLAKPQPVQPKKPVVVKTTVVKAAAPAKSRPNPSTTSSSSSSRPSASSSSSAKRKPAAKPERPPKVRKTSVVKRVQEQRVLPESDSSGDEDGTSPDGRDRTPQDEEHVVARNVAGPSGSSLTPDAWDGLVSSEGIVRSLTNKYKPCACPETACTRPVALAEAFTPPDTPCSPYATHPDFKPDPENPEPVTVTLEYPSPGARESFLLLNPKSQEEYNPISEVVRIVTVVLTCESSAARRSGPGGDCATDLGLPLVLPDFLPPCEPAAAPSPFPGDAATRASTPAMPSPGPLSPMNVPSAASSPKTMTTSQPTENAQVLRLMTRAIASNVLSLPLFLQAVGRYNALVVRCRESGDIQRHIDGMAGVKSDVWSLITDQTYQRIVGPSVPVLKEYQPFSSNVYGELLPAFLSSLITLTDLTPESVLVDLGSGVGNCCLQAALQVGCEAWGWEMMSGASRLAREQLAEARRRWAMWGLSAGRVEIREGDFCAAPEVGAVLKTADVVVSRLRSLPVLPSSLCDSRLTSRMRLCPPASDLQ